MSENINTIEAARLLGKSRQWVASLCRRKKLDAEMVGRDWVIKRESVEEYRAKREQGKKSDRIDSDSM